MQYYIYDEKGTKLDLLQNATSIQWKPRYYESGQAEIHARPTTFNLKYLKKGNRIVCKERNEILFISYVMKDDANDDIEVRGYMDNLDDRINISTVTITNVEKGLLNAVIANKRGLDINIDSLKGLSGTITDGSESTWKTLREMFETYCSQVGYGWKETVKNGKLNVLEIYSGERKNKVRFTDRFGNVIAQKLTDNLTSYKNYAYVLGEEKDGVRTMVTIDKRKEGEPLYEMYIDARDVQTTYTDSNGNEKEHTQEEIRQILLQRGEEQLSEARKDASTYEFTLKENDKLIELGKDYDLGDIICVLSNAYSLYVEARLVGLNFIEEGEQETEISMELEIIKQEVIQ